VAIPQSYLDYLSSAEVEGNSSAVYKDTEGHLTAGVGHKLTPSELKTYKEGDEVSEDVRNDWLVKDAAKSYRAAQRQAKELGVDDSLFLERLGSVNFQLGTNWTKEHTQTWDKLKAGDYEGASNEVQNSKWATQTPERIGQFQEGLASLSQGQPQQQIAQGQPQQQIAQQQAPQQQYQQQTPQQQAPKQYYSPDPISANPIMDMLNNAQMATQAVSQTLAKGPIQGSNTATSYGEQFSSAVEGGSFQFASDVQKFKAIGNLLTGRDKAAQANLNWADVSDQDASNALAPLGSLSNFLDEPSLDSFFSSIVRATGQFTPMALTSLISGGGGAVAGVLGKAGMTVAGKAAFKRQYSNLVKKKYTNINDKINDKAAFRTGRYDIGPDGEAILVGSLDLMKGAKVGAIAGAFGQEYLIGSSQALGEYQEAGYKLTAEEAATALVLGVPQALLGTLSEVSFAGAIGRTALREAVSQSGTAASRSAASQLVRDVVKITATSAGVESLTEGAQEGLQAMQRLNIDPEFTKQEAIMRVAEGAWAGFFAGGARGGVGGAAAGVIGMARDMAVKGAQYSADTLASMEEKGLQFEDADGVSDFLEDVVIPEGVKVGDEIDMYDALGNPYKAKVTAVSESGKSAKVIDQQGKEVLVEGAPSAVLNNVNSPEYKIKIGPNQNKPVKQLSDEELDVAITFAEESLRDSKNLSNASGNLNVALLDLNAIKLERKRRAGSGEATTSGPVQEGQTRLKAQFETMHKNDNGKNAVWVSESDRKNFIEEDVQQTRYKIDIPGQGILYTNDSDTATLAQLVDPNNQEAVEGMLKTTLGYSRLQQAGDGFVVRVVNKDGIVIDEESIDLQGRDAALAAMETKYGKDNPNYSITHLTKEDAVYDRNLEITRLKKGEKKSRSALSQRGQKLTKGEKQDIRDQEFAEAEEAGSLGALGSPKEATAVANEEIFGRAEKDAYEGDDNTAQSDFQIKGKTDFVRNEDGTVFEAKPRGTFANDTPKQKDVEQFNRELELGEIDLAPEIKEKLPQSFIRKFNKISRENEGLQLTIREGALGYIIATQTIPGAQGKSSALLAEEGVKEAKQLARAQAVLKVGSNTEKINVELKKGWGLIDKDTKEVTYVSMVHLTNVGRNINAKKERVDQQSGDLRTARDGLTTILGEVAVNYDLQYNGKTLVNEIVDSKTGEITYTPGGSQEISNAPAYSQDGQIKTVKDLLGTNNQETKDGDPTSELYETDSVSEPVRNEEGKLQFTESGRQKNRRVAPSVFDPNDLSRDENRTSGQMESPEIRTPQVLQYRTNEAQLDPYTASRGPINVFEEVARFQARKKKGFIPTKKGMAFTDVAAENREIENAKELRKENATAEERLELRGPEQSIDPSTDAINAALDENVTVRETKVREDLDGRVLKDKDGFPLFVKFTPKDKRTPLRTKKGKQARPANVHVSASLNKALPGIKDLFINFSKRNFFGLHRDVYIMDQNASALQKITSLLPKETAEIVNAKAKEWRNNPNKKGRIVSIGNTDFIFVKVSPKGKRNAASSLESYLTLAHEMGHVIFLNERGRSLANPTLRTKLIEAYTEDRKSGVYDAYNFNEGFDEWYADQVGTRLLADAATDVASNAPNRVFVNGHFKQVFNKIKSLFRNVSNHIKQRFKTNPVFSEYINTVTEAYKTSTRTEFNTKYAPPSYIEDAYVADMADDSMRLAKAAGLSKKVAIKVRESAKKILSLSNKKGVEFITYAADNYLGTLGRGGSILRGMFYQQSQTISKTGRGYLNIRNPLVNQFVGEMATAIGLTTKDKTITDSARAILLEAEDNTIPDNKLSPKAKAARQVLTNFKRNYLDRMVEETGRTDLSFKELFDEDANGDKISYFTRQINVQEIRDNPVAKENLVKALVKYNDMSEKSARASVDAIIADGDGGSIEGLSSTKADVGNPYKLGMPSSRERTLRKIPTKILREGGLLIAPEHAIRKYFDRAIKRTEFERRGGTEKVQTALNLIKDPVDRARAEETVMALLGKSDRILHPWFKNAQSAVLTWNIITLLTFATLASLPDLAGPVLRSKDFGALMPAVRTIVKAIKDPAELRALANEIGVVARQSMETMYINGAELEAMNEGSRKIAEGFFKYTGLEWYTQFTRVFATGMAEQFLMKHANSKTDTSTRYLAELNVSRADILNSTDPATGKFMFEGDRGQRVKMAMAQFVEESIVRPNAAERPTWVNDPRLQLVWQLKSFFYAYGKNVVGGALREGQTRWNNGEGIGGPATLLALGGLTLLPLTMVGLELRELSKDLLAKALPFTGGGSRMYRTDNMDWPSYIIEIFDRSGVFGPWTMLMPMIEAEKFGDSFIVPPFGPTAEKIEDFLDEGFAGIIDRSVPLYSSVGGVGAGFR
jgi:GH24 family phage-related lysozyme (muramidase)